MVEVGRQQVKVPAFAPVDQTGTRRPLSILRFEQFRHAPNVIGDPGGHGGSNSKRLVDATEVVKSEPHRDSGPVILPSLGKCIGEPRKAPKSHARAEVAALDN